MLETLWSNLELFAFAIAFVLAITVLVVSLLQNLLYFGLLGVSVASMVTRPPIRRTRSLWEQSADNTPGISLLVPAFNEAETVIDSVRSLLALHYPAYEVIVVNDGSSDSTMADLKAAFDLVETTNDPLSDMPHTDLKAVYVARHEPKLKVIDKDNGGKADALNAALNHATMPLICTVDADSLLESDSLLRAVQPYIDDPQRTIAVGGTVRIANGCTVNQGRVRDVRTPRNFLALLQTVEYLRAFMMARLAFGRVGALTIVSGAFGIFRTDLVREVKGYSRETVGEDLELVIKLHRLMRDRGQEYDIAFVPEPVCWTQVPESLGVLARQRIRWQRGAVETLAMHGDMLVKSRYGRVAAIGMGSMLLVDVVGPIVELLGYIIMPVFWVLGLINWPLFVAYLMMVFCFGVFVSVGALLLEELELRRFPKMRELCLLGGIAILENFGYRQLHNFWRMRGLWQFICGNKSWGEMPRQAFRTV